MANLTGSRSSFPQSLDQIMELYDLPASQKQNAIRFQELKTKTILTTQEQNELNELTLTLQTYIIDVEKWNKFGDIVIRLQSFFRDNVEGYIDQKQAEFNAEIQKFVYRGNYNSTTIYNRWNMVRFNGRTYMSLQDNNLNRPITDLNWWGLAAERGEKGDPGLGLTFRGVYNNATNYGIGDAVSYNGSIYYCILPTIGNLPDNQTFWTIFMFNATITVSTIAPESPNMDQLWIDSSTGNGKLKYWDSGKWVVSDSDAISNGENRITADMVGNLTQLQTSEKNSLVGAINDLVVRDNQGNRFRWGIENGLIFLQEV